MPSISEVVGQMRAALAVVEPELDTTVGSTTRKILDAVGEVVVEAYADKYLLDYQYDLEAKTGTDLEDFVALFGFNRLPAKRASGTVVFERRAAGQEAFIAFGTQIASTDALPLVVSTVVPAVLPAGDTLISVPVQAVIGGSRGNVAPNALTRMVTPLENITSVSNPAALTGGVDAESDDALRLRFRRTVFRSLAGTEQMFLGVCLDDPGVSQANAIGASKRYRESIQLVGGTATSTVPNAKYIYPNSVTAGRDVDGGDIFVPGVHFSFNSATIPPTITSLDSANMPDGIYDLEFEYLPVASRNDPGAGITNRIDLYVNGRRDAEATETAIFRRGRTFNTIAGDALNRANFERLDASRPVAGNYFIDLAFSPVTDPSLNDQLVIAGVTYIEGTDFWLVNDITNLGGSPSSLSGLEFRSAANGQTKTIPAEGVSFPITYTFNAIPQDLEIALRSWRLVTTDALVHQAKTILLNLHLAVILQSGFSVSSVLPEMTAQVGDYISRVGFTGVVQVSDLLGVAHAVAGVDAVRFLTSADNATNFAIQRVSPLGNLLTTYATTATPRRATDVFVTDDTLPALNQIFLTPKAQNAFGVV